MFLHMAKLSVGLDSRAVPRRSRTRVASPAAKTSAPKVLGSNCRQPPPAVYRPPSAARPKEGTPNDACEPEGGGAGVGSRRGDGKQLAHSGARRRFQVAG